MKWSEENANLLEDIKAAIRLIENDTGFVPPVPEIIAEKLSYLSLTLKKCSECGQDLQWLVMKSYPDVGILNCVCNIPESLFELFGPVDLYEYLHSIPDRKCFTDFS